VTLRPLREPGFGFIMNIESIKNKMQFNAIFEKDEYGYFAYVPALKGCITQGDTFEEALKNIKEAIELYIEDLEFEKALKAGALRKR